MGKRVLRIGRETVKLFLDKQIPRSAAALSYFLTMSLFPLIICLYTLLGDSYAKMLQLLELLDRFLSAETTRYVKHFLKYVAENRSPSMVFAGLTLLLSSASAAVRVMLQGMREIRGEEQGRQGLQSWLFSLVFSLSFLLVLYFGILVMLTGQSFLELLEQYMPVLHFSRAWTWLRFPVLAGLVFLTLWGMYEVSAAQGKGRSAMLPGALGATGGIVLMSWLFSGFIAASSRYPLVYGSLASMILLMFWLFLCSQLIYLGAALNQAILQGKNGEKSQKQ